jgi:hypothetical protein
MARGEGIHAGLGIVVATDARGRRVSYGEDAVADWAMRFVYDAVSRLAERADDYDADGDDAGLEEAVTRTARRTTSRPIRAPTMRSATLSVA